MKHTLTNSLAALLLLAIGVVGCSKENNPNHLTDGENPMNFTTSIADQPTTRATTDNTWIGNEKVAILVHGVGGANDEVKKYNAKADGKLTVANGVTPWYWQSTSEKKIVSAWYPYNEMQPTSFTVQVDQSSDGYQQSDMIYADQKEITFTNKQLTFKHLPAKVVINLINGNGMEADDLMNATVTILNQATTSGNITSDWNVSQVEPGNTSITPYTLTILDRTIHKSVQALLVPQQMQGKKLIKVTCAGNDYFYTPQNNSDANFVAGKQYTYNITVNKTGINVSASGATKWTGSEKPVTSYKMFNATDLKSGDYYYSDGTWSDGGLRKFFDNGTFEMDNVAPQKDKTVVGIVYWVGDATKEDIKLKEHHSKCTNGLVVSLGGDVLGAWQDYTQTDLVQRWLNLNTSLGFMPVQSGTGATEPLNNIQGYNNTKAIEKYNAANAGTLVNVVKSVIDYRKTVKAPSSSSDWYVPSIKELTLLCGKDVEDINNNNSGGTINFSLINRQISAAGGIQLVNHVNYWSSTEFNIDQAFRINFKDGDVAQSYKYSHFIDIVRFTLAF